MATEYKIEKPANMMEDSQYTDLSELTGLDIRRVYLYEFENKIQPNGFLRDYSTTIITIKEDAFSREGNNLLKEGDHYYIETVISSSRDEDMAFVNNSSSVSKSYESVISFGAISNQTFKYDEYNQIIATLDKPLNVELFNDGLQEVFTLDNVVGSQDLKQSFEMDDFSAHEYNFSNIENLLDDFANSEIKLEIGNDTTIDLKDALINEGVEVIVDSSMLLNNIRSNGVIVRQDNGEERLSDLELRLEGELTPIKMTPTSIVDKLIMTSEWFDEDKVLPLKVMELFKGGKKLSDVITNTDDLNLIEDMVTTAYLMISKFKDMPLIADTSNVNVGKFDPAWGVGHSAVPVSRLENAGIDAIDSLYETHIRNHPTFDEDINRSKLVKGIINALCRYIFTSYTVANGNSTFGWAYLPWFLSPTPTTASSNTYGIKLIDKETIIGTQPAIKRLKILDPNVIWYPRTNYINSSFFGKNPNSPEDLIDATSLIHDVWECSDPKTLYTDRNIQLPHTDYNLKEMVIPSVTGTVDPNKADGLAHVWMSPANINSDHPIWPEILSGFYHKDSVPANTPFDFQMSKPSEGIILKTNAEKEAEVKKQLMSKYKLPDDTGIVINTLPTFLEEESDTKTLGAGWRKSGGDEQEWVMYNANNDEIGTVDQYVYDFASWLIGHNLNNGQWSHSSREVGLNEDQWHQQLVGGDFYTRSITSGNNRARFWILQYIADSLNKTPAYKNVKFYDESLAPWPVSSEFYRTSIIEQITKHIKIKRSNLDFFEYNGDTIGMSGKVEFTIITSSPDTPANVSIPKDIEGQHQFSNRKVQFDKEEWFEYLDALNANPSSKLTLKLNSNKQPTKINELTFDYAWGERIQLNFKGRAINIKLINQDDETVSRQHILFV